MTFSEALLGGVILVVILAVIAAVAVGPAIFLGNRFGDGYAFAWFVFLAFAAFTAMLYFSGPPL